jgi:KDO2-lipid IV(A) lauroyltransferase
MLHGMSPWKRFRHRLEAWGCLLLEWGIPLLSRRGCVALGRRLGALAFRFDARGQAVALDNLACVFGNRFSEAERGELARASYQNFARTMLDLFWARRLTPENFRDWMQFEGFEELRARLAEGRRGSVFMCVHQGNWEWASLGCGFLGFHNMTVAEDFKNPLLAEIFRRRREHSGQVLIGQDASLLRMLRAAKQGGATGMLIDLNLRPTQAATVIEGFGPRGLKMCVPLLHAALAQRAGALLVPVETQPQVDGTCRIIAHPALEFSRDVGLAEIAQRCWDAFEPILDARPAEWLWPYKHFRYRPRMAGRSYPDYAHESGKFEKLLRTQSV